MDPAQLPLAGYRIVEAAQMISAPLATSLLCDQGAEVIKVEAPSGDRMRSLGDHRLEVADDGSTAPTLGSVFHSCNRGKRSVALDTKSDAGREALIALIGSADVFVQNFRPGAAERMGIGADAMRAADPSLIYVSVSGFGPSGPYADQMVYDFVVQGVTGMAAFEGLGEASPRLSKNLTIDKVTALTAAQAITAALLHRERTGHGQHLELSMVEAGLQFVWPDAMWNHTVLETAGQAATTSDSGTTSDAEGTVVRTPPMATNYDVRPTKDGYITLNLATNSTWGRLCAAIDPALEADPRFSTYVERMHNGAALAAAVDRVLADLTTAEALARLRANDVPGGPVHGLGDVHLDPQVVHNGSVVERVSTSLGLIRDVRPAARFGAGSQGFEAPEPAGSAPRLGEHSEQVLRSVGFEPQTVAALVDAGTVVIG